MDTRTFNFVSEGEVSGRQGSYTEVTELYQQFINEGSEVVLSLYLIIVYL